MRMGSPRKKSTRFHYQTPEILVGIGNSPTLTIPESLRTTTVRGGQSATVLWSSNLTEKNRDHAKEQKLENWETTATEFEVKVYKQGDWDTSENEPNPNASPVGEAITVSSSMESVKSSVTSGSSGPSSSTSPTATVTNWDDIQNYWETVQDGKSGNDYQIIQPNEKSRAARSQLLSVNSTTGQALYGSPSTATLEDRSYLDNPRTYGGSMTVLRARANALTEKGTTQEIMTNSYPGAEPYVTEDGALMAFLHDYESDELDETRASYVDGLTIENGGSNIEQFPEPEATSAQAEGNVEQATGGDSQLRLAGDSSNAVAVWSRVTETLEKEPGSAVTSDEQMLMMNSTEIFASVKD